MPKLFTDTERYVTRSVANHLNDISKLNADFAIELAKKWHLTNRQDQKEMEYIIRHGLRTLLKQGNLQALELLGFKKDPKVKLNNFSLIKKSIFIGEYLEFKFDILSKFSQKLLLDYCIIYPGLQGRTSKKVF